MHRASARRPQCQAHYDSRQTAAAERTSALETPLRCPGPGLGRVRWRGGGRCQRISSVPRVKTNHRQHSITLHSAHAPPPRSPPPTAQIGNGGRGALWRWCTAVHRRWLRFCLLLTLIGRAHQRDGGGERVVKSRG